MLRTEPGGSLSMSLEGGGSNEECHRSDQSADAQARDKERKNFKAAARPGPGAVTAHAIPLLNACR
eukprot:661994-Rhodomonas_salina.1